MRLFISLFCSCIAVQAASAQNIVASQPDINISEQVKQLRAIQAIERKLNGAGYTNLQLAPQVFAVWATDRTGRTVFLLVDANEMAAVEVEVEVDRRNTKETVRR
jgi:hypothetical protein